MNHQVTNDNKRIHLSPWPSPCGLLGFPIDHSWCDIQIPDVFIYVLFVFLNTFTMCLYCVYIYVCIHIYIHAYICMYIICTYNVYIYICICMHTYACISYVHTMYIYIYVYVYTCIHMHVYHMYL